MTNFLYIVLGHLDEFGAPVTAWRRKITTNLLDRLTHPDFNPYLVSAYRMPVLTKEGKFFTDWRSVLLAYQPEFQTMTTWPDFAFPNSPAGYVFIALAAASYLPELSNEGRTGEAAWQWMSQNVKNKNILNSDPTWAIVPRTDSAADPADWPILNASEATGRRGNSSGR